MTDHQVVEQRDVEQATGRQRLGGQVEVVSNGVGSAQSNLSVSGWLRAGPGGTALDAQHMASEPRRYQGNGRRWLGDDMRTPARRLASALGFARGRADPNAATLQQVDHFLGRLERTPFYTLRTYAVRPLARAALNDVRRRAQIAADQAGRTDLRLELAGAVETFLSRALTAAPSIRPTVPSPCDPRIGLACSRRSLMRHWRSWRRTSSTIGRSTSWSVLAANWFTDQRAHIHGTRRRAILVTEGNQPRSQILLMERAPAGAPLAAL